MTLIANLKNYFTQTSDKKDAPIAPEGICPNCWGKQEWEGEFFKKIKANNITPENKIYENFIHEVAQKLTKITLKEDLLVCETCEKK